MGRRYIKVYGRRETAGKVRFNYDAKARAGGVGLCFVASLKLIRDGYGFILNIFWIV